VTDAFERGLVVDVDTHLTEPPDTWTARVSSKYGDAVPHIERIKGRDTWVGAGGLRLAIAGQSAMAGFDGNVPDAPKTFDDMPKAAWDAEARLRFMDEEGIWAHVLYPNVGGFGAGYWLTMADQTLALKCVRAYNDFQTEFCSIAPQRLLAVASIPFWDFEATMAEAERCIAMGHVGINFCNQPDVHGAPPLFDPHWDPLWTLCQEAGVPVNCHIGGGDIGGIKNTRGMSWKVNFARASALMMLNNMNSIGDFIFGGVCHRFPELKIVSVESGIGFVPSLLETFDWQWRNGAIADEHPEYDLLPSEYFRRQMYATFWFETDSALYGISRLEDNTMFESDFPHPTCQHPGPKTPAKRPRDYVDAELSSVSDSTLRKVLYETATRVYKLASRP
jgi:predicted TIM-barrel fold metal-dependent hydrolase